MRAWGLFLLCILGCIGCASAPPLSPDLSRYGGPPMPDVENFDRAAIDCIRGSVMSDVLRESASLVVASRATRPKHGRAT
jgi:hypothetical protein